ncbi:Hint domain-containing protein [Candidatus Kirkpatrickella diaphorinae]|uniref:Hint domain-containing protein n=1 Tax=Candidatus Kirkpatrickella diaphorinae TaxID=2984322 RepID=A0ABY6GLN5_9PROT|nr:Hint domain-containing protein [Candidatus Kirkpatrickella diaphorinae]UYH51951.1 Hint domain-containing protein [Candidatus Kirkpatrickella diaphorinae]
MARWWVDGINCFIIDSSTSTIKGQTLTSKNGVIFKNGGYGDGNIVDGGNVYIDPNGYVANSTIKSGLVRTGGGTLNSISMTGGDVTIGAGTTMEGKFDISGAGNVSIGKNGYVSTSSSNKVVLNVSSGNVSIDQIGPAALNLARNANVSVTKAAMQNLTVNATATDYSFDITDLDPSTITGVTQSTNKFVIHTTKGDVTINGNLQNYKFTPDNKGGTIISSCFAEGTLIQTPDGDRLVETLELGDLVSTHLGPQPIRWLGKREVDLRGATEMDNFLVRIKADAFDKGLPKRDLWITPEHCILINEKLIPVRRLVNGASIAYDLKRRRYTYYHFAFEKHAIVFSEALPSESYLIGQNKREFGVVESSGEEIDTTLAYPLVTEIEEANRVWQRLAARSNSLGMPVTSSNPVLSRKLVQLRTDRGEIALLKDVNDRHAVFSVPAGTKYVVIESDASRPDQFHGPYWDDRRRLGVRVGPVHVSDQSHSMVIDAHLNDRQLGGWNNVEDGRSRWTSGKGIIPLAHLSNLSRHKELELRIAFPDREEVAF